MNSKTVRTEVRPAGTGDLEWLKANDVHAKTDLFPDWEWVRRCIEQRLYLIAVADGTKRGFLRFSLHWGAIPYMDMIGVDDEFQRAGIGTMLLRRWEEDMKAMGAKIVMTSCMSDEPEPRAWHERNGYRECGSVTFGKLQTVPEVFMEKEL